MKTGTITRRLRGNADASHEEVARHTGNMCIDTWFMENVLSHEILGFPVRISRKQLKGFLLDCMAGPILMCTLARDKDDPGDADLLMFMKQALDAITSWDDRYDYYYCLVG